MLCCFPPWGQRRTRATSWRANEASRTLRAPGIPHGRAGDSKADELPVSGIKIEVVTLVRDSDIVGNLPGYSFTFTSSVKINTFIRSVFLNFSQILFSIRYSRSYLPIFIISFYVLIEASCFPMFIFYFYMHLFSNNYRFLFVGRSVIFSSFYNKGFYNWRLYIFQLLLFLLIYYYRPYIYNFLFVSSLRPRYHHFGIIDRLIGLIIDRANCPGNRECARLISGAPPRPLLRPSPDSKTEKMKNYRSKLTLCPIFSRL